MTAAVTGERGSLGRVRVVAFSDTGSATQRRVAQAAAGRAPDVVAFLGDVTDSDAPRVRRKALRRWTRDMAPIGDRIVAVPGNHDHDADGSLAEWAEAVRSAGGEPYVPGTGLVRRVGGLELIGIGTGAGVHRADAATLAALRTRTSGDAMPPRARIAMLHEPLVASSAHIGHALDAHPAERDALIVELAQMGVRLVLCGHEHAYIRRAVTVPYGLPGREIVQVTCGGGGAALDATNWTDVPVFEPRHHVVTIDLVGDRLWVEAHAMDGALLDRFGIELGPPPTSRPLRTDAALHPPPR